MIQINILGHHNDRVKFMMKSLNFINKIKDENKEKIKLIIYCTTSYQYDMYKNIINDMKKINNEVILTGPSYMNKINMSINSNSKYSCSMDDDIMISNHVWDYFIENIDILDNDDNLLLSPVISNGIPTCDYFIEDFCNDQEKDELINIFKNQYINNYWGVDYNGLNNFYKKYWNFKEFYSDVSELNHYYKGIHPVRISTIAHKRIAEIICNDPERFFKEKEFQLEKSKFKDTPYFCNSFYFIKTDILKKIINDKTLFKDGFDEVPLNLYRQINDINFVFIRNAFCFHMAYNTIGVKEQNNIQQYIYKNLLDKI